MWHWVSTTKVKYDLVSLYNYITILITDSCHDYFSSRHSLYTFGPFEMRDSLSNANLKHFFIWYDIKKETEACRSVWNNDLCALSRCCKGADQMFSHVWMCTVKRACLCVNACVCADVKQRDGLFWDLSLVLNHGEGKEGPRLLKCQQAAANTPQTSPAQIDGPRFQRRTTAKFGD